MRKEKIVSSNELSRTICHKRLVFENIFQITGTIFEIDEKQSFSSGFLCKEVDSIDRMITSLSLSHFNSLTAK
jgi:hypothetical protein